MIILNEASTGWITVNFFDKDGEPATPLAASYWITDYESDTEITSSTEITPLDVSVEVKIVPAETAIVDTALSLEKKIMTVTAEFGTADVFNEEYIFYVKNLHYVPEGS